MLGFIPIIPIYLGVVIFVSSLTAIGSPMKWEHASDQRVYDWLSRPSALIIGILMMALGMCMLFIIKPT